MKLIRYGALAAIIVVAISSCKKTPASFVIGTYEGNYSRDSVSVGAAIVTVGEVNSLTVNVQFQMDNDPDFTMLNVGVNGSEGVYNFLYDGTQGEMEGVMQNNTLNFTVWKDTDTLSFSGEML